MNPSDFLSKEFEMSFGEDLENILQERDSKIGPHLKFKTHLDACFK